jgi:ferrous iron transport protein B
LGSILLANRKLETSFLAQLGHGVAPIGQWMALDWRPTVPLLTSFLAKENSIATLGVLCGSGKNAGLAQTLAATYSPASGLAFLVVSLLFIPCAATVAAIRQEMGSWRWTLVDIAFMLLLSIGAGIVVFHLASVLAL